MSPGAPDTRIDGPHLRWGVRVRALWMLLIAALTATVPAACGGQRTQTEPGRRSTAVRAGRLTPDQAGRASRMLYENHLAGGASVEIAVTYSSQLTVAMSGAVDWSDHRGRFTVTTVDTRDGRAVRQQVVFTSDDVYARPLADSSAPPEAQGRWTRRPPDRIGHPIDRVIALVAGLAAVRPDNPLLVRQGPLRAGHPALVAGARADVFTDRVKGVRYWVDRHTGELLRVRGALPGFAGPCVIDLRHHRRVVVDVPAEPTIRGG